MDKRLIVLGILSLFLLSSIATVSAGINLENETLEKDILPPEPIKNYYLSGDGRGLALNFGGFLFLRAPWMSGGRINYISRNLNTGEEEQHSSIWLISTTFDGTVSKVENGYFEFEGVVFGWLHKG